MLLAITLHLNADQQASVPALTLASGPLEVVEKFFYLVNRACFGC